MTISEAQQQLSTAIQSPGSRNYQRVVAEMFGSLHPDNDRPVHNDGQTIETLRTVIDGYKKLTAQLNANCDTQADISRIWRERYEQLAAAVKAKS